MEITLSHERSIGKTFPFGLRYHAANTKADVNAVACIHNLLNDFYGFYQNQLPMLDTGPAPCVARYEELDLVIYFRTEAERMKFLLAT